MKAKIAALALGLATTGGQVDAIEFSKGKLRGSIDTTISYGVSVRVQDRDEDLVGKANLNPLVSQLPLEEQIAAPGRFSVNSDDGNQNYDQWDLVSNAVRIVSELGFTYGNFGGFFRAFAFYDFANSNKDFLSSDAENFVGNDVVPLDAFLFYDFAFAERAGTVRVGKQVVSWGEPVFIQGGVNVINPVDVARLRTAGAELRDAFLPVNMIWGSIDITNNLSVEALYPFEFEQTNPEPAGSYFSTNDFATPGGDFVMLGFGLFDEGTPGVTVPRAPDDSTKNTGQYGIAARYFAPHLSDAEFGFYYLNYHSRLPLINGITVTNASPESGRYFISYPEDINLWGASFNVEAGGVAFAGEVSYRNNQPYQIDDVELLFAALSPLNSAIPEPVNRFTSQLGEFGFGEVIPGFTRHEVTQIQGNVTKIIGPNNWVGADQVVLVGEGGLVQVWNLPDKDDLRYQGPGTDTGGGASALTGGSFVNPVTQEGGFADDFSWGYRLVGAATYNSVFGTGFNLTPRVAFSHDVNGTSPGPGGPFVEDRKTVTAGIRGSYLQNWGFDLSYTAFLGGDNFNLLRDRDFVSASVSYAF